MHIIRSALLIVFLSTLAGRSQPTPGKQVEMKLEAGEGRSISYLLYVPTNYSAQGNSVPLLLFLHGRGESDGPLSLVKKWGPPRLIERGEHFPYVVASPQCPRSPESWGQPSQQTLLLALLDHLETRYNIDRDRVYLTGLSMGGYGSWRLAADHPERFAAVAPICGGGKPEDASRLASLPIWVWHGTEDGAVPLKRSVEMVEAIQAAGGKTIKFTTLEGIGHNSWEAAYATPELYQWMDQQSVSKNRARNPAVGPVAGNPKFASLDGTRIHYVRAGTGSPTLVLVHGWASHAGFWHEQEPALAGKASLIFIDLPGHGLSDKPQTDYSIDYFARAVVAVLKDAGVDKAVLIGHSMGTPVICRAYTQAPDKIAGLVSVDGTLRRPNLKPEQIERIVGAFRTTNYQDHATRFIGRMFPEGAEALRDKVVADVLITPQHVMRSSMEQMFDPNQPAWDLPKLDVPVIALLAPNAMWDSSYEEYVRSLNAKADYRIIPGCGHFLMLEKPAEFNAALVEMLEKAGLL